jgi:hypothetical protein
LRSSATAGPQPGFHVEPEEVPGALRKPQLDGLDDAPSRVTVVQTAIDERQPPTRFGKRRFDGAGNAVVDRNRHLDGKGWQR